MKQLSLSGSLRRNVGKKDAAELRKQGKVPAVIYGGSEQVHFFFEENEASPYGNTIHRFASGVDLEFLLNSLHF